MQADLFGFRIEVVLELLSAAFYYRDHFYLMVSLGFPSETNFGRFPVGRRDSSMKKLAFLVLTVLCFSVVTVAFDDDVTIFTASLRGANEVPAINSDGSA